MGEIRQATILIRDRQVTGGAIPSSALMAEPFVNLYDGVLRFSGVTGGGYEPSSSSSVFEVGSTLYNSKITNRLNINDNFIISGDTGRISTYDGVASSGFGGKFLSGTTSGFVLGDISDIQGVTTRVQPGTNITTGGTADFPTVNLVDSPSINGLTASGTSNFTGVIQSGGTDLYGIFLTSASTVSDGTNTTVSNIGLDYKVNVVDSPSFNDISFSGTATGGNAIVNEMSATTFYSGSTDVETIIYNIAAGVSGIHTFIQNGTNIVTGGTAAEPTVNLVASPSINNLLFSGTATGGNIIADSLSATTVSGGTIYSGSTDLYSIFQQIGTDTNHTQVQPGSNITTGGTTSLPTISLIASPSINTLTASGSVITNGTTYSGGTIQDDGIFIIDAATQVEVDSNLLPSAHLTYDLGAVGQRWDELYVRKIRLGTSSTTLEDQLFSSTTGNFVFDFAGDLYIDNNTLPNADIAYDLGSGGGNRWKTIYAQDLDITGELAVTGITDSSLTTGRVVYVGTGGKLIDEAGFEYDEGANLLKTSTIQIGNPGDTGTTTTIYGDLLVMGQGISGFTSELYIEDNLIELNYNPTASTISTSLGAGWSIQDGSGVGGTDVFWDIRGTATGVANRSFATNLNDIRIRETGTISAPNGVRVIAENDVIDGGSY